MSSFPGNTFQATIFPMDFHPGDSISNPGIEQIRKKPKGSRVLQKWTKSDFKPGLLNWSRLDFHISKLQSWLLSVKELSKLFWDEETADFPVNEIRYGSQKKLYLKFTSWNWSVFWVFQFWEDMFHTWGGGCFEQFSRCTLQPSHKCLRRNRFEVIFAHLHFANCHNRLQIALME